MDFTAMAFGAYKEIREDADILEDLFRFRGIEVLLTSKIHACKVNRKPCKD
jgi:hypothetical protein